MSDPSSRSRRASQNATLATLVRSGTLVGLTDGELLDCFNEGPTGRAELAFAALVERHGPLVWGVCRRTLADQHDAEDAFQATFLILVRQARSVRAGDSLGRWLFGVSRRVASRTRADRDRRRRREATGHLPDRDATDPADLAAMEALRALDAEVARLAEPFRSAILLCDLGGRTHEQAALDLGCPVGTVKSRLARGRDRLRARLVGRGLDGALVASLARTAPPPPALVGLTLQVATRWIGSGALPGPLVGSGWFPLTNGVSSTMLIHPLPWLGGVALAGALSLTGLTWIAGGGDPPATQPADPAPAMTPAPVAAPQVKAQPDRDYVVEPPDLIRVEVLKALPDRPITGERLVRPDGKITLGYYGEVSVAGLTLAEIKAKVVVHLRDFLADEDLGLAPIPPPARLDAAAAVRSTRVYVDLVKSNSKNYDIQGDVGSPGRLPITGSETVLDAIVHAGGLVPAANPPTIRLVRPAAGGEQGEQVLPVDLPAIVERGETTTNYAIRPGDRIIVSRAVSIVSQPAAAGDDRTRQTTAARGIGNGVTTPARPQPSASLNERIQRATAEWGQVGGSSEPGSGRTSPRVTPDPGRQSNTAAGNIPRELTKVALPDYVVEPPDIIVVQVLEALPGQPITGERQVRPDGKVSLGYYGEVYVSGLTAAAIKEKVVLHLKDFLTPAALGLTAIKDGQPVAVEPGRSTRVFVDVVAYNSKVYYVQGQVGTPGRLPVTGNETVLDALNYAGGLTPRAAEGSIRLVRPAPPGACCQQILPVDLDAILNKGDTSTNYQMMPSDRLVVPRLPDPLATRAEDQGLDRDEIRIREIERKLDLILQKLEAIDKPPLGVR